MPGAIQGFDRIYPVIKYSDIRRTHEMEADDKAIAVQADRNYP
jgi:hypothetical protein